MLTLASWTNWVAAIFRALVVVTLVLPLDTRLMRRQKVLAIGEHLRCPHHELTLWVDLRAEWTTTRAISSKDTWLIMLAEHCGSLACDESSAHLVPSGINAFRISRVRGGP